MGSICQGCRERKKRADDAEAERKKLKVENDRLRKEIEELKKLVTV